MDVTIKKVDKLGRIVLPKNYRQALGIDTDSEVVLGIEGSTITVKACGDSCRLCGSKENVNKYFSLCLECITKVKGI